MDIHLDSLLRLPNVTVFTCYQKEGFIILELDLINQGINCPHCQAYTDKLHQDRPIEGKRFIYLWTRSILKSPPSSI